MEKLQVEEGRMRRGCWRWRRGGGEGEREGESKEKGSGEGRKEGNCAGKMEV